jgi:hypothetical protein
VKGSKVNTIGPLNSLFAFEILVYELSLLLELKCEWYKGSVAISALEGKLI